jgi:acyl carrier protein
MALEAAERVDVEGLVLAIVGGLVDELAGRSGALPHLDDSLDRDLGISSLERVELLIRIERAFGVRLADSVMAEAATPGDLEKDLVVQGGRNLCAEEIETIAASVSGIRRGCVAAFGVPDPAAGTERLVVVAETRERNHSRQEALERAVRDRLVEGVGSPPDVVVIADPHTVLKTPSGKIRRGATRAAYVNGTLGAHPALVSQRVRVLAEALGGRIRRLGDWVGRTIFTAWVAVVSATLLGLWGYLAIRSPGRHARCATQRWCRFALTVCGLHPRVVGLEHLDGLGAFRAAVETARSIVPIAIAGTRHVLPDGTWLFRPGRITVTISAPLEPRATGWPEMVRLRDRAVEIIERGSSEAAAR